MVAAPTIRKVFATPRASEFFELRSLQATTGQPANQLAAVVIKELMDNALDAAESAGVAPEITLAADIVDDNMILEVTDNGPGMPSELIDRILDFSVLVSDKARFKRHSARLIRVSAPVCASY